MKISSLLVLALACFVSSAVAQAVNGDGELRVTERGPHHRVLERMVRELQPDGSWRERRSSYTELATGLHYLDEQGRWQESKEEIQILNGAAAATQGPVQVIFAANLNSAGAIDLLAPDGQRFRSHVLGLFYTDYASGQSVLIAQVKDSVGAVLPPNQVIYQDAFDGDFIADVKLTCKKSSFEQDVVLMTSPPSPAEWGLNPETTRLEVMTEFIEAPAARVTSNVLKPETGLTDQHLDFGSMVIGQGQAFPLGETSDPFSESAVPTAKSLERIDGRVILIEQVDYPSVREHLGRLPKSASINKDRKTGLPGPGRTMMASLLPARPSALPGNWRAGQYAKVNSGRKGFVLDYITTWTSSLTNYVLKGDTTYFITNSATVNFYGTTVIDGGAVLKTGTGVYMYFNGPVDCRTDAYRPAFLTAKDDNSVGEPITGSSGTPSGYYGYQPFGLKDTSAVYDLHDLHLRYSTYAFTMYSNVRVDFSNIQIGNCGRGVAWMSGAATTWRNFLFHDLGTYGFQSNGSATNRAEHGTLHRVGTLISSTNSTTYLFLTNSLLIAVTNSSTYYQGAYNVVSASDSGFFQTAGAADHYLASGSTNRDAGTTNINTKLLAALKKRTTYPPTVIGDGSYYTNSLTLYPQAGRDSDVPDLGYHHDPLDYVFSGLYLTNATITAMPGVAIGTRTLNALGLGLLGGANFYCEGTADNLNRIVRYNTVQEQSNTNWTDHATGSPYQILTAWTATSTAPQARIRFTEFSMPASSAMYHFYGSTEDAGTHDFRDCQFHTGVFWTDRPTVGVTNSLFNRTDLGLLENYDMSPAFRNCTFVGGDFQLYHAGSGTWTFKDNLFDATTISYEEGAITHDYNAYTTNATRLATNGANDVVLTVTNIAYDTGWLGRFYIPTNLTSHIPIFDSGSAAANTLGLYHYTMVTNQTRELTTTVDRGFHYVAVNSSGEPIDTDGDGVPDYLEDANGNGIADSGETDWETANEWGLRVYITRPRNGSNVP